MQSLMSQFAPIRLTILLIMIIVKLDILFYDFSFDGWFGITLSNFGQNQIKNGKMIRGYETCRLWRIFAFYHTHSTSLWKNRLWVARVAHFHTHISGQTPSMFSFCFFMTLFYFTTMFSMENYKIRIPKFRPVTVYIYTIYSTAQSAESNIIYLSDFYSLFITSWH